MRLVEDAKRAYRWFSVQAMVLAGTFQVAWEVLPKDMRESVPDNMVRWLTLGLLVLGIVGRLVKQDPK